MTAEKYLEKLKKEMDLWQKAVDDLPGNTINVNNSCYRMSVNAANKYHAAKYMMELMKREQEK